MEYTYSTYQVPAKSQLPYVIWQLLTEVMKGGSARNNAWNNHLKPYFEEIAKLVAERFFGISLITGNGVYRVYICVTRHLVCAFLSQNAQKVYFCNIQIVDTEQRTQQPLDGIPETGVDYPAPNWTPSFKVEDVRIWKLVTADTHNMEISRTGSTVGVYPKNKKFPVLGMTEKKLIVPPCSFFVEGMHVDIFKYPYVFLQAYQSNTYTVNENWYTNFTNEYKFKKA